ncbi:MAG TPA: hypothetical protein VF766_00535 [Pyrinomonadaceae bacterium]
MKDKETRVADALRDCMSRWPVSTFLCGIGVGVSLMYLLDPKRGSRRRARISQGVRGAINDLEDAASSKVRDFSNRAKGVVAEARSVLTTGRVDDESSAQRSASQTVEDQSAGSQPQAA